MRKRILWMGFDFDEEIEKKIKESLKNHYCDFSLYLPEVAIYDYDIVVLNLLEFEGSWVKELCYKKEEFEIFLKAGKVIVCILEEPKEYKDYLNSTYGNYEWLPFGYILKNNLHKAIGKIVKPYTKSEIGKTFEWFKNFNFVWRADMISIPSYYTWERFDIIAVNNANLPVSFLITLKKEEGNGKVLFIPQLEENEKEKIKGFHIQLVNSVLKLFKIPMGVMSSSTSTPAWITEIKCYQEDEIKLKKEECDRKLQEFHQVKRILYERGRLLVEPVALVFKKLGYNVMEREKLGREDIEITFNGWEGLVEVKSIESETKRIDKTHMGQVFSHLMSYPEEKRENVRCILVVNYDVTKPLQKRRNFEDVFTPTALELAKLGNICLISTKTLWEIYNAVLEKGENETKRIRELIANANGILKIEK